MLRRKKLLQKIAVLVVSVAVLWALLFFVASYQDIIEFADKGLETAVREKLDKPEAPISRITLLKITHLDASGQDISNLRGIENLRRLVAVELQDNKIEDLAPLGELSKLTELNLSNNGITDLEAVNFDSLSGLPLRSLSLQNNVVKSEDGDQVRLSDVSLVNELNTLEALDLRNNHVADISPLSDLNHLQILDLRENLIEDLSPLQNLTSLIELNLRANLIKDLSPLSELNSLIYLNVHSNTAIDTIEPLAGLQNLHTLIMRNVYIGDQLDVLQNMTELQRLNIRNCGVEDTVVLAELMAKGVLQDDPEEGLIATVDIRDNVLPEGKNDPYCSIRKYWLNIGGRMPLALPFTVSPIKPPAFSHQGGFYFEEFSLTLSHPDDEVKIYYTMDGSEPTKNSNLYLKPIEVKNRHSAPNILSIIPTARSSTEPDGNVYKGTVLRAAAISNDGTSSEIVTRTFFVDPLAESRYSLPVLSLTTNPDYLFDNQIGIYTEGNAFNRGSSWERPVHIEFYEENGELGFSQNIGIRIHGGATRNRQMKSLRLLAGLEYDKEGFINYELFPGLKKSGSDESLEKFKTVILRNSGNDWGNTLFRDGFMQSLVEHSDKVETQAYRPVIVFINGEYWGIHNLREHYTEYYIASHYDVSPDDVSILIRNAHIHRGSDKDSEQYLAIRNFAEEYEMVNPDHYNYIMSQIDIKSLIIHYISNIYFNNYDWPHNNIYFWRINSINNANNSNLDMRWRWMMQDKDFGFGLYRGPGMTDQNEKYYKEFIKEYGQQQYDKWERAKTNTLAWALYPINLRLLQEWPNVLIRSLMDNDEFKYLFINTMADYLNSYFHPDVVANRIKDMQDTLTPEIEEHIMRWRTMEDSKEKWNENIEVMRTFGLERPEYVREHFIYYFELSGTAEIELITDPQKGKLRINSLDIKAHTPGVDNPGSWTGTYFKDIPIIISALPNEGYRFAGWKGINQSDPNLTIILEEDVTLTAKFVRE